jgi:hypothetical protein
MFKEVIEQIDWLSSSQGNAPETNDDESIIDLEHDNNIDDEEDSQKSHMRTGSCPISNVSQGDKQNHTIIEIGMIVLNK